MTVTVKSVKERELPEPDDEFAQLASEFDTIDELKDSLTEQVRAGEAHPAGRADPRQGARGAARADRGAAAGEDRAGAGRRHRCTTRSTGSTTTRSAFAEALEAQGSSREEFDADNRTNAEKAVKTQLLMDAIADKLDIQVGQNDLTERLVLMSRQYGLEPQQLLQYLQENNQLPAMFADVRRGLTVAAVVHGATVTDTDGNVIDTTEFFGPPADDRPRPRPGRRAGRSELQRSDAEPSEADDGRRGVRRRASDAVSERAPVRECAAAQVG